MTTVTFYSSTTWTCPAGVGSVQAECWAGGGGGAGGASGYGSGGAGGGEYAAEVSVAVTAGNIYTVTVGAGGAGAAAAANGHAGGNSSFVGNSGFTVTGHGGGAGLTSTSGGGAGGTGYASGTHFNGGAGAPGITGTYGGGGGAGGSAGSSSAGQPGTVSSGGGRGVGGTPVINGGDGGAGGNAGGGTGANATSPSYYPGGGGGGGGQGSGTGAAGQAGQVQLTYTSAISVAGPTAGVTVTAPAGVVVNYPVIVGPVAAVTVAAPAGTVSGATTTSVGGVAALVAVTAPAGAVTIPAANIAGVTAHVTVGAPAGFIRLGSSLSAVAPAESASLVIANQIELLQGGVPSAIPACAGAIFYLAPGYDLGAPQPITDIIGELVLDGERPFGRRASNRTITLPIVIIIPPTGDDAADLATLAGARETLLELIEAQTFTLTWTRDGGFPLIFDCFRELAPVPHYSVRQDRQFAANITVSFQALPYGRSDIPQQLSFASPATGSPAPPPQPVLLDDYETVSGSNWSRSAAHVTGSYSARWIAPGSYNNAPTYSSHFGPVDITGRNVLQHYAGFASPQWYYYFTGSPQPVRFTYTLHDAFGQTVTFGAGMSIIPSSSDSSPNWYQVSANIPSSGIDFTQVNRCDITTTGSTQGELNYTDLFLDDLTAQPVTTQAAASIRGSLYTLHGVLGTSHAQVTLQFEQPDGSAFSTLIAHRPGPDAPPTLTPFVSTANVTDPPDGRQYPVVSQIAGLNARFAGTYTIILVANSFNSPSSPRTVSVAVWETEFPGGPSSNQIVTRTFTPSTDISNGIVVVGELTLPGKDIPPDNVTMFHTAGITDSNLNDQWLDILLMDTQGQTVIINTAQSYAAFYLDEPDSARDIGRTLGSATDRTQAISVLDSSFVSGGPLTVDPGDNVLFVYSISGTPALVASYSPRWILDRTS